MRVVERPDGLLLQSSARVAQAYLRVVPFFVALAIVMFGATITYWVWSFLPETGVEGSAVRLGLAAVVFVIFLGLMTRRAMRRTLPIFEEGMLVSIDIDGPTETVTLLRQRDTDQVKRERRFDDIRGLIIRQGWSDDIKVSEVVIEFRDDDREVVSSLTDPAAARVIIKMREVISPKVSRLNLSDERPNWLKRRHPIF